MRKLFSQKSKQKGFTGSSFVMPLSPMTKVTSASSEMQNYDPNENSLTTQLLMTQPIKSDDHAEKSKKLFVVVSDVDAMCTPILPNERTDCRLLSVDECEGNELNITLPLRSRSSTCSGQHSTRAREQNPKKFLEERLRRRSWIVFQTNNYQASDLFLQTNNSLRLRRFRLGQSEPNLNSLQMTSTHPTSLSVKTSPRTSSAAPTSNLQFLTRRSSARRPNLSSLNLINLKHALRKQLSPQQQPISTGTSELTHDSNALDDNINRRWSLTSAPSSSGYGTTSPPSSQYSSFERLQHQQHICTCRQLSDPSSRDDLQRLESHSISMSLLDASISSSPSKMCIAPDQDINTMAFIYKERYPKAKVQMEERLQNFIDTYKLIDKFDYCSDGSARFIHNQIVELAKDCLEKSHNDLLTTLYFNEMNDNLERLLLNANEKCPQAIENLQTVVRKLLLTIARSARLLECLQFDPETFLRTLEEVECQAKAISNFKHDIPKYICSKLNLERNPLDVIDILNASESTTDNEEKKGSVVENESDALAELNYLTITPNSTFPLLENTSSAKGPCEEDFEILKLISNGAYGAVHLIKHRQTHERYAMKKISKTQSILRNQIEQVFVERDIMTFTDNPFVVALICTFETKNHLCLVMEYVEGGDVATLLKNIGGPLNIDIARMYFAETTLAVEYLHSYGVIHRDLKPDNLLITAVGHIKLTDFGLSKIGLMSLTTNFYEKLIDKEAKTFNDKQICGTPTYIAPEVILRQGYGKPVDWWSLGIILYEFLVGCPPFTGNTPDELFANVISGEIDWDQLTSEIEDESPEEVFCPEARDLIEQLLVHDPSKRLGSLGGSYEIRTHSFCSCINWHSLLREKADFVPVLESMDDTSYFDSRKDRYKHSDDEDDDDPLSASATNNDSDSLFASFSSVSLKYASELSGTHKQSRSHKHENDTASSAEISRANSCSDSFNSSNNIIRIESPNDFQPLLMTQSMTEEKGQSLDSQPKFGSDTFEPLLVSSDESESSSKKFNSSSSSLSSSQKLLNTDEKKPALSSMKHYKQRKTSLKLLGQQESVDSGDDNHHEINKQRYHKKSRIPRALSPIQFQQNSLAAPTLLPSSDEKVQRSSSLLKPVKDNNQQPRPSPRSLSKSFSSSSSSSSPPPTSFINQDERFYRQTHRHNMAVSPLERDTTLKAQQQNSYSSSSLSPIRSMTNHLRPPIIIRRGPRSFGFTLRAVKVFHGNTDYYTTQHVVVAVQGPAEEAGLRPNDVITHVNEQPVSGLVHSEVVKLILSGSQRLSIRAISCSEAQIRIGGRRRSPSKQKNRFSQPSEKKSSTPMDDRHQSTCQKHRVNSSLSNPSSGTGNNANKKHQHNNTSLFRRLSERKVARDIEAAAAAAAGISLTIPPTCLNTNKNSSNNSHHTDASPMTTTNVLSSSLPLLIFNPSDIDEEENTSDRSLVSQHHLDPSEWPPLISESDCSQSTLLPALVKQKSQTFISPLVKCLSPSDQPVRQSLCKVPSDPLHLSCQSSTMSNSQVQFTFRQNHPDQNYFYAPMLSTRKRKLVRQKPVNSAPSPPTRLQSLFIRETNLNCNIQPYHQDPLTRSLSTESSSPVVSSARFFYRQR